MTAADPDTALPLDPAIAAARASEPPRWRRFGRGLRNFVRRSPLSAFWGCIAALIILVAVAAPELAPYPPLKSDFRAMAKPPGERHYFGTDQIGRDTLSRVIYGSRASLAVAMGAVLFGTTLGALWGLASGYFGGRFDLVSQRIIEFLQSFPDLILAMAIAMALGAGFGTVIVAIAITRIPFGGRVIRAVVLSLKELSYVEAARGLGASHLRISRRSNIAAGNIVNRSMVLESYKRELVARCNRPSAAHMGNNTPVVPHNIQARFQQKSRLPPARRPEHPGR